MPKGQFIVVEGLEGAGKSTAIQTMKRVLRAHDIPMLLTREPGGTEVGEVIRHLLKQTTHEAPLVPRAELLLFYAARVQLIEQIIRPALAQGIWVLADRFEWSTFAYQGGGRQLDQSFLKTLSTYCVDIQPDWIFFLDISPELGLKRAHKRGALDRIEQEALPFFKAVQNAYDEQLKTSDQVVKIDASQPLSKMKRAIREAFSSIVTTRE